MENMLKDCVVTRVSNDAVAATTTVTSSVLDMAGFDGVMFIALVGDVTSTSVITLTAKENTANSTSSPTPTSVSGGATGAFTADATSADNGVFIVDVIRPSKRYVYCTLARGTANAVVDGILAIQYRAKNKPVTQPASVLASALSTPEA